MLKKGHNSASLQRERNEKNVGPLIFMLIPSIKFLKILSKVVLEIQTDGQAQSNICPLNFKLGT